MASTRKDRLSQAAETALRADSLVGSYFHSDAERGWQGCVVAEPAPGLLLVETFEWIAGASHDQALVRVEDMGDWRFYDTADWMTNAYEHGVRDAWDRARKETDR